MSVEPASPSADSSSSDRPVARARNADLVVSLLLFVFAILLGWDSWRTGATWADDGPEAGYFPFYLSAIMAVASLVGVVASLRNKSDAAFVTREQITRVMQVFVPMLAFVIVTAFLGLYVASFLLVAGFMWWVGNIAAWKSVLVALAFTAAMFITFEISFNVIMPKGPLEAAFGF